MVFYYLFFFLLVFLAVLRDLFFFDKKLCLLFCFLLLFFFSGFRDVDVSKDGTNYVTGFEMVGTPFEYFIHYDDWFFFEPFYYLFPSILKLVLPHLYILLVFLLYAIIGVHLNLKGIFKLSYFPIVSLVVYFPQNYLLHEMTQIRVGVACGFLLLCSYYHYHQKYFSFLISVLVSLLFHYVSLLILTVLILKTKKFSRKNALIILVASLIISVFRSDFIIAALLHLNFVFIVKLSNTLQAMDEEMNSIHIFNVAFLLNLAALFWLIYKAHIIQEKNKYGYLAIKVHLLSIVSYLLFTSMSMVAFRLYEFFGIINVITVPFVIYTFKNKIIGYSIIFIYALLIMAINLHVNDLLKPYGFFKLESLW